MAVQQAIPDRKRRKFPRDIDKVGDDLLRDKSDEDVTTFDARQTDQETSSCRARNLLLTSINGAQQLLQIDHQSCYRFLLEKAVEFWNAKCSDQVDILDISVSFQGNAGFLCIQAMSKGCRKLDDLICTDLSRVPGDVSCNVLRRAPPSFIAFYLCRASGGSPCMTAIASDCWQSTERGWCCVKCGSLHKSEFGMLIAIRFQERVNFYRATVPPRTFYIEILENFSPCHVLPEPIVLQTTTALTDVLTPSAQHAGGVFQIANDVFFNLPVYDWDTLPTAMLCGMSERRTRAADGRA